MFRFFFNMLFVVLILIALYIHTSVHSWAFAALDMILFVLNSDSAIEALMDHRAQSKER